MLVNSQFIDESLDIHNCQNYTLSIQFALDGFSFSVFDHSTTKFIALLTFEVNAATTFELKNELEKVFAANQLLSGCYTAVKVMFIQNNEFLIPNLLFDTHDQHLLQSFLTEKNIDDELISHSINRNGISAVSSLPQLIRDFLFEKHPNCTFFPPSVALFHFSNQPQDLQILVSKFSHVLTIIAIEKDKVEFFNSFQIKNDDDLLYYLFNVAKKLKATQKTEIILLGNIDIHSTINNQLKKYFDKVIFPTYPKKYAVSYILLKEPDHQHIPLLELALCE